MQDFDTLYKSFSNKDLLKITTRPELYLPLAVKAATRVLALRTLEEADRYQAAEEIQVCFSVMGFRHLNSNLFYALFAIALHAGLLRMFNKNDVQNFFGVNKKDFKKALVY